jgi:hypothetical protein
MWASWRGTKYTIRGKVVASPKSRLWWVLWVRVCPWLVLEPKVFQLCTNHLVFGFMQVHVNSWCLSLFLVPSRSSNTSFYPQSATNQGVCPNSLLFLCFQFRFTFESIKELGSTSFIVFSRLILGFIVFKERKILNPKKVQTIVNMLVPTNPHHIQVF